MSKRKDKPPNWWNVPAASPVHWYAKQKHWHGRFRHELAKLRRGKAKNGS